MTDFITVAADVASGWNGITSDMLLGVLDEIKTVLPIVVPAVVKEKLAMFNQVTKDVFMILNLKKYVDDEENII